VAAMTGLGKVAEQASKGWSWWTAELQSCVPARLRTWMKPANIRIEVAEDAVTVRRSARSASSFALPLIEVDRALLIRAIRRRRTAIIVAADRALTCPVDLPLAAERAVPAALRFEVDRRTPFKAANVHIGYRIRERDSAGRKLKVDLVCVPKRLLDQIREIVAEAGATVEALAVDLPDGKVDLALDGEARASTGNAGRIATLGWVLGGAAALAGVFIPLLRLEAAADSLEAEVASLRQGAARAADLERQLSEFTAREEALDAFLAGKAPLILLAELARISGDDTHFTGFRFDGGTIYVDGQGASAAGLAEVIENSPHFRNPVFRAAVVPASGSGEQFSLSFDIERAAAVKR